MNYTDIYEHREMDRLLWRGFADFHLDCFEGFWSPQVTDPPHGRIPIGMRPSDRGDLLWSGHTDKGFSASEIIRDVENISASYLNKPGFYLNASFDEGLITELRRILPEMGYKVRYEVDWLTLNVFPDRAPDVPAGYSIRVADDASAFLKVYRECFPETQADDVFCRHIETPSKKNIELLVLYDPSVEPVAMGCMGWGGPCGTLFCLGVRPDWRRQGLAKFMVDWRLHQLYQRGVKHVVTGVLCDNEKSYALQRQKGYRTFAHAQCWLK